MRTSGSSDCFVVINGPEDGTEFPLLRAPFYVGEDVSCAVNVRLDRGVRPFHAHVSVVSEGYRIRRTDAAPVYVNGKRTGMLRSRIVRSGGLIQVGNTKLVLECAPDGLASRSHGITTETDLGWVIRQAARGLGRLLRGVLDLVLRVFGWILGSWLAIALVLGGLYLFCPPFHRLVRWIFYMIYYRILYAINS